ncbi:TPA: hypothetical protein ACH3X1_005199 [Trebouxia sp. C0004]
MTILELPVPDEVRKEVYFRVGWYNRLLVSPDPKYRRAVEHDVFFVSVLGSIAGSQPWLGVMHYESSATDMPDMPVLLSDNGKPVEIQ